MKRPLVIFLFLAALAAPVSAISPKRLEGIQKRAAAGNKLIAFVVEQDYYNPGCPKCITEVNGNNKLINRAAPNKGVIVVKLEKDDLKQGEIPDGVLNAPGLPRIVITNADGSEVIDVIDAKADKARIAEMEQKIAAALGN